MNKKENSQTAYLHNAHSFSSTSEVHDHGWVHAINRMIDQRYAFLNMRYENNGHLFRGMSSGFFDALLGNHFWTYSGDDSGNQFERELDILLLSQDFSDAFTIAKLWEQKSDACIIIFQSKIFNNALNEKKAAMMATAEPGVVFKYPFLSHPLTLEDIDYLIVSADFLSALEDRKKTSAVNEMSDSNFNKLTTVVAEIHAAGKIIVPERTKENSHRSGLEKVLMECLLERAIVGAKTIKTDIKPMRTI